MLLQGVGISDAFFILEKDGGESVSHPMHKKEVEDGWMEFSVSIPFYEEGLYA